MILKCFQTIQMMLISIAEKKRLKRCLMFLMQWSLMQDFENVILNSTSRQKTNVDLLNKQIKYRKTFEWEEWLRYQMLMRIRTIFEIDIEIIDEIKIRSVINFIIDVEEVKLICLTSKYDFWNLLIIKNDSNIDMKLSILKIR